LIPHLQPADVVLPQQCQAAEIGMSAGALLSRPRLGRVRRVMQQAHGCHRVTAVIGEIILRQIKRERDAVHHPRRQVEHDVEIGLHHRPEIRTLIGPLIGAVIEHAGNDARIVKGVFWPDIIAFFEVRRRAGFQCLALQRLVATVCFRLRLVDFGFLCGRQSEEGGCFGKNVVDQRLRNTVVLDVEETLVEAGRPQLRTDGFAFGNLPAR